jgi:hypothetical protein
MDLFQSAALANNRTQVDIVSVKLAIFFSEETDIPSQYHMDTRGYG